MNEEEKYTVWVGGTEVTDHYVDFDEAYYIASCWHVDEGYDDVIIEEVDNGDTDN